MSRPLTVLLANTAARWIGEAAGTDLLARVLHERGHRVVMVVPEGGSIHPALTAPCRIVRVPWRLSGGASGSLPAQYRAAARLLREVQPDIVHVGRGQEHWCLGLLRPWMPAGSRLVRTRHVVLPMRQVWSNRWLFRARTDAVTAVSQATFAGLGQLGAHLPEERRRVVLGAVDMQRFAPARRDEALRARLGATAERPLLVGCLGRWQNIKGPDVFLEAMGRVIAACPQVHAVMAGRKINPEHPRLRAWHEKWQLEGRITYLGMVEDVPALVASLDVGVIASRGSEGFSRIAVEYMASGVPVVATRVGALPEIVRNAETGRLVPSEDPGAMAEAIVALVRDATSRRTLAERALREAHERFAPERLGREMEAVYRAALAAPRASLSTSRSRA